MHSVDEPSGRLMIVANRLPVSVENVDGEWRLRPSSGGLATGLGSFYSKHNAVWVGWPGTVPERRRQSLRERLVDEHQCYPVFLASHLAERYYEGYANRTLWPLFHSFPMYTRYVTQDWDAYREANRQFCENVVRLVEPGDTIWVHDYQLMLLPQMLRERLPDVPIGFFLHIPFPQYDILRLLPQHQAVLESLLAADLVGLSHLRLRGCFLNSIRRMFGYESVMGQVLVGQRAVQAEVFAMGIDFARFASAGRSAAVQEELARVRERVSDQKLVFSVSRLDYTKGIPQHLDAIDYFFQAYPEWRGAAGLRADRGALAGESGPLCFSEA